MNRTRRSLLSFFSSLLYTVVTLAVALATTPLLLCWLGNEVFGACRVLTDWYGQFRLLELGLGASLLPMLATGLGRADSKRVSEIVGAGIRAYIVTTLGFLAAGVILAAVATWLIPVGEIHTGDLQRASLVGLLAFLITPLTPFRLLAEARQDGLAINVILLGQSLVTTAVALLLGWAGWGITGQVTALVTGIVVCQGLLAAKMLLSTPIAIGSLLHMRIHTDIWRELGSLCPPTFFRQICTRVSLMSDAILVAFLLEPALVVPMIITQRLAGLAQVQLQGIASASWAGLAELHTLGRRDVFRLRLLELTTLVTVLSIAVLAPITAFNHAFVGRWVGSEFFAGSLFSLVAASNAILLSLFTLWDSCFIGTGQVVRVTRLAGVSAAVNLGVSIFLTSQLGIIGPLLGTLTALLFVNGWWTPYLLKKHFQVCPKALCKAVVAPLTVGLPYWALVWWFAYAYPPQGWIDLALNMAASALVFLAVAWVALFSAGERAVWISRIRSLLRLRSASNPTVSPPVTYR